MLSKLSAQFAVVVLLTTTAAFASGFAIPAEQVDAKKVYWGATTGFDKAGEVDYESVLKATPEAQQLKKEKVQRGTGKYWILMSQASDRATRAIAEIGQSTDYDLIAVHGYLATLTPAIPAEDVTKLVLDRLEGSSKLVAQNKKGGKEDKGKGSEKRTAKAEVQKKADVKEETAKAAPEAKTEPATK